MSVGPELDRGGFGTFERDIERTRLLDAWEMNYVPAADDVGAEEKLPETGAAVKEAGVGSHAAETLFSEDFSSGSLAGWTVVDQGTIDAPSNWQIVGGELRQTSNIYSNSGDPGRISTPGTYVLTGDAGWSGYTVSVRMKSTDNDALG